MEKVDLDDLERLEKAATPGPWEFFDNPTDTGLIAGCHSVSPSQDATLVFSCASNFYGSLSPKRDDRDLIAALRNAAPHLIARAREAERLEETLTALKAATAWQRQL